MINESDFYAKLIKKLLFSGIDSKKKLKGIYHIYNDLNVITPTKKKPVIR